jgi:hypothetical protein
MITFGQVSFPIPSNWRASDGNGNFVGPDGLLDIRTKPLVSPIDQSRIRLAQEEIRDDEGGVTELTIQGFSSMRVLYKDDQDTVDTYSLDIGADREVVAVYILAAGSEWIANFVYQRLIERRH